MTCWGSMSPCRGNKAAAAAALNFPFVSPPPLPQCFPRMTRRTQPPLSHGCTYFTRIQMYAVIRTQHTNSRTHTPAWTSNVTFFCGIRTPQLPEWHYFNIYTSTEGLSEQNMTLCACMCVRVCMCVLFNIWSCCVWLECSLYLDTKKAEQCCIALRAATWQV